MPNNCSLSTTRKDLLEHVVHPRHLKPEFHRRNAIRRFNLPTTPTEPKIFQCFCKIIWWIVAILAQIASFLTQQLMKTQPNKFAQLKSKRDSRIRYNFGRSKITSTAGTSRFWYIEDTQWKNLQNTVHLPIAQNATRTQDKTLWVLITFAYTYQATMRHRARQIYGNCLLRLTLQAIDRS